jgi:hypothetical protein
MQRRRSHHEMASRLVNPNTRFTIDGVHRAKTRASRIQDGSQTSLIQDCLGARGSRLVNPNSTGARGTGAACSEDGYRRIGTGGWVQEDGYRSRLLRGLGEDGRMTARPE